jgi:hypothetical protein
MDDINPPMFIYDDSDDSFAGKGRGPGREGDKIRFNLPY